jgi:hypothetical protein
MLDDVRVTELDGGRAEVRLRDTVATVQPNPHKLEAERALERALRVEAMARPGPDLERAKEARYRAQQWARSHDAWTYTTGHGETFSHPDRRGALHMARKWFVEAGIVLVPFDHSHMNPGDRLRAVKLQEARDLIAGPRWGDYVQLPGHVRAVSRICGISHDDARFGLTGGGSFSLPGDAAQLTPHWESYSGALDWDSAYRLDDLEDAGRHEMGRFWFFSGGVMAAHGGVDVALPCRVYLLKGGRA